MSEKNERIVKTTIIIPFEVWYWLREQQLERSKKEDRILKFNEVVLDILRGAMDYTMQQKKDHHGHG